MSFVAPLTLKPTLGRSSDYPESDGCLSTRRGHDAYWRMTDRRGVAKALRELGYV